MVAATPEEAVEMLDRAFNQRDIAAVLDFYEDAAVVVTEPGKVARGKEELHAFFERVMQPGSSAKQLRTHVIETDGIALFLSRWTLNVGNRDPDTSLQTFTATTVFRQQPNGGWKALIDNAFGPLVLGPE